MKIFVFGSNGMLGTYISDFLSKEYKIIKLTRADYDLNNLEYESLKQLVNNVETGIQKNDVIINCAGIIPQSSKEAISKEKYYKINSIFPLFLSIICKESQAKMIHITTDCVFSGNTGSYNENSIADETTDYGVSKSLGELCNCSIIRTSIIGEEKINKRSLLEYVKFNKNKVINGYENHLWNGVTCLQLSKIINKWWKGVRHIFSPQIVSKYELLNLINEIYELNIKVNKFKTNTSIDKSLNTIYKFNNNFNIPNLKIQIQDLKKYNI